MKQTTEDDALFGLAAAIIYQAVLDYQLLQKNGIIDDQGKVVGFLGRMRTKKVRFYRVHDGMNDQREVLDLIKFLRGWGLELLCDLCGQHACRIRSKLGLTREEAP